MTTPTTDQREARVLRQRIADMLTQAATWLGTLYGMTGDGNHAQAAAAVRAIADAYRAPVNPDWRFEHDDERRQ